MGGSAGELWDNYLFCLESLYESCTSCGVVQKRIYVRRARLKECYMEQALGDGGTAVTVHEVTSINLTHRILLCR
jgi:hypothetical protein